MNQPQPISQAPEQAAFHERISEAIAAFAKGEMLVLVDDEDRENEGDLVLAASFVTPAAINFMATHARGLICLALTEDRVRRLGIPLMVTHNHSNRSTAFTVSIEASEGVTTGISASDRAHTVRVACAPTASAADIVSPGHIFPLQARPGGVLQRSGHTEGAVDLARLAGVEPAAVICEIMNEDGTMARMPDLKAYADRHRLRVLSVADLIAYRLSTESLVSIAGEGTLELPVGNAASGERRTWRTVLLESPLTERPMLALVLGDVAESEVPTLVRVHKANVLGDIFGAAAPGRTPLASAKAAIEQAGAGVILLIPEYLDLRAEFASYVEGSAPSSRREQGDVLREYGLGAQALRLLGLGRLRLLTNHVRRLPSLDAFGICVEDQLELP